MRGTTSIVIVGLSLAIFVLSVSLAAAERSEESTLQPTLRETEQFEADVAVAWFNLAYDLVRDEGLSPSSRIYGYSGVALYEAVVPGMLDHQSLVGQLNGLDSIPRGAVPGVSLARGSK